MDDETRDGLLAKLSGLRKEHGQVREALQAHGAHIEEIRRALGNPYFFTPRPTDDPESSAHYTGYASHDPALRLLRDYTAIAREIRSVQEALRQAGVDPS